MKIKIQVFIVLFFIMIDIAAAMTILRPEKVQDDEEATSLRASVMIFKSITKNIQYWEELSQHDKIIAINWVIEQFRANANTAILNSPEFYIEKVNDALVSQPSEVGKLTLLVLIELIAQREHDFYNGQARA